MAEVLSSNYTSGPPGTGVCWDANVRGLRWSGMLLYNGIGPWGRVGQIVDRSTITKPSAAEQFDLCLDALAQNLLDTTVNAPWFAHGDPDSLDQVRVIFLHISDIAYLSEIDARWAARFPGAGPVRSISVHPIRGGAKVEIDAWCGGFVYGMFRKTEGAGYPESDVYVPVQLTRDVNGWRTLDYQWEEAESQSSQSGPDFSSQSSQSDAEATQIITEDYATGANAGYPYGHPNAFKPIGTLQFCHFFDEAVHVPQQGMWHGRDRYAYDFDAEYIYAHSQRKSCGVNGTVTCTLSGFDVGGQLTGYAIGAFDPIDLTLTPSGSFQVDYSPPSDYTGESWFEYQVSGPSGVSRFQRYFLEVS